MEIVRPELVRFAKDPKPWTPEHWEVVSISGPSPVFHPTSRIAEWLLVGGMIWGIGSARGGNNGHAARVDAELTRGIVAPALDFLKSPLAIKKIKFVGQN